MAQAPEHAPALPLAHGSAHGLAQPSFFIMTPSIDVLGRLVEVRVKSIDCKAKDELLPDVLRFCFYN